MIPINVVNGLPYIHMHPYTNHEWDTLPHIILMSDVDWDPTVLIIIWMMMNYGTMLWVIWKPIHLLISLMSLAIINGSLYKRLRLQLLSMIPSLTPLMLSCTICLILMMLWNIVFMRPINIISYAIPPPLRQNQRWLHPRIRITSHFTPILVGFLLMLSNQHFKTPHNMLECQWVLCSRSTIILHTLHSTCIVTTHWFLPTLCFPILQQSTAVRPWWHTFLLAPSLLWLMSKGCNPKPSLLTLLKTTFIDVVLSWISSSVMAHRLRSAIRWKIFFIPFAFPPGRANLKNSIRILLNVIFRQSRQWSTQSWIALVPQHPCGFFACCMFVFFWTIRPPQHSTAGSLFRNSLAPPMISAPCCTFGSMNLFTTRLMILIFHLILVWNVVMGWNHWTHWSCYDLQDPYWQYSLHHLLL